MADDAMSWGKQEEGVDDLDLDLDISDCDGDSLAGGRATRSGAGRAKKSGSAKIAKKREQVPVDEQQMKWFEQTIPRFALVKKEPGEGKFSMPKIGAKAATALRREINRWIVKYRDAVLMGKIDIPGRKPQLRTYAMSAAYYAIAGEKGSTQRINLTTITAATKPTRLTMQSTADIKNQRQAKALVKSAKDIIAALQKSSFEPARSKAANEQTLKTLGMYWSWLTTDIATNKENKLHGDANEKYKKGLETYKRNVKAYDAAKVKFDGKRKEQLEKYTTKRNALKKCATIAKDAVVADTNNASSVDPKMAMKRKREHRQAVTKMVGLQSVLLSSRAQRAWESRFLASKKQRKTGPAAKKKSASKKKSATPKKSTKRKKQKQSAAANKANRRISGGMSGGKLRALLTLLE